MNVQRKVIFVMLISINQEKITINNGLMYLLLYFYHIVTLTAISGEKCADLFIYLLVNIFL